MTTITTEASPGPTGTGGTVWLCRPGRAADPCTHDLAATTVPAAGARTTTSPQPSTQSPFDCFYVYPTVSPETTENADLRVQPAEIAAAVAQASQFSPLCRVWAPMYRQITVPALLRGQSLDPAARAIAYSSLLSGFEDYLRNSNEGRPIIFIGHSQGAAMLTELLQRQVDGNPALRSRTLMAIIAGGNVVVPDGAVVGATFQHLPLCTSQGQTACVIAYSTFPSQPPPAALFGRPGQGVSLQSGQSATRGVQVACVNPASIGGGTADLSPLFVTSTMAPPDPAVTTPWVAYPHLYSGACMSAAGATWLQVTSLAGPGDHRPLVTENLGPNWGYHVQDINLALGNLVSDVAAAESAYKA